MDVPDANEYPQYQHHGAAGGVTGSCHRYLADAETHFLIDCGLFQGQDVTERDHHAQHRIEFDIGKIQALIVTHVHIDHVGRIPYLFAAGFRGPIYCSEPSARLLPLVIEDALKVGFTRDEKLINQFLAAVHQMIRPLPYKQWLTITDNNNVSVKLRLQRAGHILGSAYVELDSVYKNSASADKTREHHRTVYSGDLGAPYAPLLPAPKSPYGCDTLIIESTYGNRLHENRRERRERLRAVIDHAMKNQGTVMIPAFSIGRTQEILYELEGLIHEARAGKRVKNSAVDWSQLQVIVDSPLASKFNDVYRELKPFWDAEAQTRIRAGRHPLSFENLITIDSHEDHLKTVAFLARTKQPAVVLAASGMAAGGRIVNYLKAMLSDPAHCVLFVGYQARGTTGHRLLKIGKDLGSGGGKDGVRGRSRSDPKSFPPSINIDGKQIEVRTQIRSIGGYSAHADQKDLLNFVRRMHKWPAHVRVIHGERKARESLRSELKTMAERQGREMEVVVPDRA